MNEAPHLPEEPDMGLTGDTKMLLLPMVAAATLRYVAPPLEAMVVRTRGPVSLASLHLARWGWQGRKRSAYEIAEQFQHVFFPYGVSHFSRGQNYVNRMPRKGFDLIRAVDELSIGSIEFYCDMPHPMDYRRFQTVRLKTALSRLNVGEPEQISALSGSGSP